MPIYFLKVLENFVPSTYMAQIFFHSQTKSIKSVLIKKWQCSKLVYLVTECSSIAIGGMEALFPTV